MSNRAACKYPRVLPSGAAVRRSIVAKGAHKHSVVVGKDKRLSG
jgi:hypothetical protein